MVKGKQYYPARKDGSMICVPLCLGVCARLVGRLPGLQRVASCSGSSCSQCQAKTDGSLRLKPLSERHAGAQFVDISQGQIGKIIGAKGPGPRHPREIHAAVASARNPSPCCHP